MSSRREQMKEGTVLVTDHDARRLTRGIHGGKTVYQSG